MRFTWSLKYTVNIPVSLEEAVEWRHNKIVLFLFYCFQNTRYVGSTEITLALSTDSSCLGSHFARRIGSYSCKIMPVRTALHRQKQQQYRCCNYEHSVRRVTFANLHALDYIKLGSYNLRCTKIFKRQN